MAQERKKRRIVLASILKPVDDTRMYEKMAVSLAQSGDFEVSVIGYPTTSKPSFTGIEFISLPAFHRLSLQRVLARWRVFAKVWRIKPSILIINTHELLPPSVLLKILLNITIVYDIQENYYRNILHSGSFPWLIRWPLAMLVRLKEKLLAPSIDHFILAERGYEQEFKFHRGGWTVIENKALHSPKHIQRATSRSLNLLFSGTLAESTGVFHAIRMAIELHQLDPSVKLTIIGKAALNSERERIQNEIKTCNFITLTGGKDLVPHQQIIQSIENADFGILSYPYSYHTRNSHPTKLFEYLSYQLPVILDSQWPWIEQYVEYHPFIIFDFSKPDYPTLLDDLKSKHFYSRIPENVTWASQEGTLLKSLNNL